MVSEINSKTTHPDQPDGSNVSELLLEYEMLRSSEDTKCQSIDPSSDDKKEGYGQDRYLETVSAYWASEGQSYLKQHTSK